jgi:hypothetical protein
MAEDPEVHPIEEPLAELERQLIDEYLRGAGHDPEQLRARHDEPAARALLTDAATYAASRLAEVEARSHYVRNLHGQE